MAGTTWMPMTRMEPKQWLLGNGEVVTEPALEMSGTGKKVRVAGTKQSVFASQVDELIGSAVEAVAQTKQTDVWMEVTNLHERLIEGMGFKPAETKAKLHLVHEPNDRHARTIVWWRFKDPNTLMEAYLWINLAHSGSSSRSVGVPQELTVHLSMPSRIYFGKTAALDAWHITHESFSLLENLRYRDPDLAYKWQEFVRDNPADLLGEILGTKRHPHARAGVQHLLEIVRKVEDVETIQVPNLGNLSEPSWLALELYETNCNSALITDLSEYLDGGPTIEKVAELYQEMLTTLRGAGIQVSPKTENDFMAALLEGDKGSLNMDVLGIAEEDLEVDYNHKVSVHLPSGSFIVECSHQVGDRNAVAEKWEEALTMASLTGQESALLAYSRKFAEEQNKARTQKILKERQS